jgi:hypothetical protein
MHYVYVDFYMYTYIWSDIVLWVETFNNYVFISVYIAKSISFYNCL